MTNDFENMDLAGLEDITSRYGVSGFAEMILK